MLRREDDDTNIVERAAAHSTPGIHYIGQREQLPVTCPDLSPDQRKIYDDVVTWVMTNATGLGITGNADATVLPSSVHRDHTNAGPLWFIHGGPGTGKSYLVRTIHEALCGRFGSNVVRFTHDPVIVYNAMGFRIFNPTNLPVTPFSRKHNITQWVAQYPKPNGGAPATLCK
ncbi:MAG: hypothetical protein ACP5I8_13745 [Phycisphaerae bacterium]